MGKEDLLLQPQPSSNEQFQNDTVKSIVSQILLINPNAKVVIKGNITNISNFIISEQDIKNLVVYIKDVFNPDTSIRGINSGVLDNNGKFKRFPTKVLLANKIVFCKKFDKIIRLKQLEKTKNPSDNTSSSMNIGDFYDTAIIDEIMDILGDQPTKNIPKYYTAISLVSTPYSQPNLGAIVASNSNSVVSSICTSFTVCVSFSSAF